MTEITPKQDNLSKIAPHRTQKSGDATPTGNQDHFSNILMKHLDTAGSTLSEAPGNAGGLPELEATVAARLSQAEAAVPDLAGEVSHSLERLDIYARWLGDPGKTLRDAHGLLEEIDASVRNLKRRADEGTDPPLKSILNHMATLVAVEKIKLNRGDYT